MVNCVLLKEVMLVGWEFPAVYDTGLKKKKDSSGCGSILKKSCENLGAADHARQSRVR